MAAVPPDEPLVVAPLVTRRPGDDGEWYAPLDPVLGRRRAVRRTGTVDALLACFADPATPARVARAVAPDDPAAAERGIAVLHDAGLLVAPASARRSPPSLELEITNHCNADCVMCPRGDLRPLGHMTEETFAGVRTLARAAGASGAIVQGIGEPTLHRRLAVWLARLRADLGPGAPIVVVTNGSRMTPGYLGELVAAGVSLVQWSLHALHPGLANRIMGWERHDDVLQRFRECAERFAEYLAVNVVVMDANRAAVPALRAWLVEQGIPEGRIGAILPFSRGSVDARELDQAARDRAARDRAAGVSPPGGQCLYARKGLFIAWDGAVLPCSNDIRGRHPLGSVQGDAPSALVERWWRDLATRPVAYPMCHGCDHHSRGSLPTSWFDLARDSA